jgi:putative peptidoglycan lipid II flippase
MAPENQTSSVGRNALGIGRNSLIVGFFLLGSRFLGLLREQMLAASFGAGSTYDAFLIAFRIPGFFKNLVGERTIITPFVTLLIDLQTGGCSAQAQRFINATVTWTLLFISLLVVAGIIGSDRIVALLAPQFAGHTALTGKMTAIMFPFLLFMALSVLAQGLHNAGGSFMLPSLALCMFNVGIIVFGIAGVWWGPSLGIEPILGVAVGVLAGGMLQLALQVPKLLRRGYRFTISFSWEESGFKKLLLLSIPAVLAYSAVSVNMIIDTFFAARCVPGSLSWLNYATVVLMLPVSLLGVPLATGSLPTIANLHALNDRKALTHAFESTTVFGWLLAVPASFGLLVLIEPIVRLLFEHGRFNAFDTLQTAAALRIYALGLIGYVGLRTTIPVFYVLRKPRFAVSMGFLMVVLHLLMLLLLIPRLDYLALPLSTTTCVLINYVGLNTIIHKRLFAYRPSYLLICLAKIVGLSAIMAGVSRYIHFAAVSTLGSGALENAAAVVLAVSAGLMTYCVLLRYAGINEARYMKSALGGLISRVNS